MKDAMVEIQWVLNKKLNFVAVVSPFTFLHVIRTPCCCWELLATGTFVLCCTRVLALALALLALAHLRKAEYFVSLTV